MALEDLKNVFKAADIDNSTKVSIVPRSSAGAGTQVLPRQPLYCTAAVPVVMQLQGWLCHMRVRSVPAEATQEPTDPGTLRNPRSTCLSSCWCLW